MNECPITLCPFHELRNPVVFLCAPNQPYELDALCTWMELDPRNPLTGEAACVDSIVVLGSARQQQESMERIERRGLTISANQVCFSHNNDGDAIPSSSHSRQ